ncbi:MAG: AAA family ATPase [Candidatus Aminicenantes bacterium]|nr:AAA family ATPase [Candidatus Aminicenantes bacterium]
MNKIKRLKIKGIRGIREPLNLKLGQNPLLLYGANGSGKSSITDAVEWFYHNRIAHLSSEEVGPGGTKALPNIFLEPGEKGGVVFEFSDDNLDSAKTFSCNWDSPQPEQQNKSDFYRDYLKESQKENLFLRHRDLVEFILASKKEKLDFLSKIIGFAEVTKVKDTLRKTLNELKKEIKIKDFANRISRLESRLIEFLNQRTVTETQFTAAVNLLLEPLRLQKKLTRFDQVDEVLDLIKDPGDRGFVEQESFYIRLLDWLSSLDTLMAEIETLYEGYYSRFQKIAADSEKISKILLERLLSEGERVLREGIVKEENCPLCLQPKSKSELLAELGVRLGELEKIKKEKIELEEVQETLRRNLDNPLQRLNIFLSDRVIQAEEHRELSSLLEKIKDGFAAYRQQLGVEISAADKLADKNKLLIDRELLRRAAKFCREKIDRLKAEKKENYKYDFYSKIVQARDAYLERKKLQQEKKIIEKQAAAFDILYSEFLKRQEEGIASFLTIFSKDINHLYRFMNPGERVEEIKLAPLQKNDELVGITLEYKFFEDLVSPPQKYLSESHLNCLGIAFFLTSVKAFNKRNNFFILDDVISSFDGLHRKRFAELLVEKFPSYQVIMMTHEQGWFEEVRDLFKSRGWQVAVLAHGVATL